MSGPSWERREPNRALWRLVGALASSAWILAMYGGPLVAFAVGWVEALEHWSPRGPAFAAHVVMATGYLALGITGLYLIWVPRRLAWVYAVRVVTAVAVMVAATAVAGTDLPESVPGGFRYTFWAYVMALVAVYVAVFGAAQFVIVRRRTPRIGPDPLT